MSEQRFDPARALTFDFEHGIVSLEGAPSRVLVPADALAALCASADENAVASFGRALGEGMGLRVAKRFGETSGVRHASLEDVVDHLGGELALAGLGTLGAERWGRALVLVLDQSPLGEAGDALLTATLAGALRAATGTDATIARLARDGARLRMLVTNEPAASRLRAWLDEGLAWGEALVRLHAPRGNA